MTVTELVSRIRDVGNLAVRADTTDQKIVDEANAVMSTVLVPVFRKMRGGFLRDSVDQAIVANQVAYPIPERGVESGVEQVKYLDADGNEIIDLKEINTRQIGRLSPQWWLVSDTTATTPSSFYFDQGAVNLSPVVTVAVGSLRMYYQRRPGKLVLDSLVSGNHTQVGVISSIASNSQISCSAALDFYTNGYALGLTTIDVMSAHSPYKLLAKDVVISAPGVGSVTLAPTVADLYTPWLAGTIQAGDYVTFARTSFIPEVPQEWHDILVDFSVARMHAKLGNLRAEQTIKDDANARLKLLIASTSPRGSNVPRVVFPSW